VKNNFDIQISSASDFELVELIRSSTELNDPVSIDLNFKTNNYLINTDYFMLSLPLVDFKC
jgi:hypothetical protein